MRVVRAERGVGCDDQAEANEPHCSQALTVKLGFRKAVLGG